MDSLSTCGHFAAEQLQRHVRSLVGLQSDVLADRDPEPLHQMRVRFRRVRSTLGQFAPALVLPERLDDGRIAKIGRRLGIARDLDVLRARLQDALLPLVPEREGLVLKPVLKQLRRERKLAFSDLQDTLQGRRYLRLLADLQGWLRQPRFTTLGEELLLDWWPHWKLALASDLLAHPGWRVLDPHDPQGLEAVHDLRKRLKRLRYGLANLQPLSPDILDPWLVRLKAMQEHLGDLNDLQVLQVALAHQLEGEADAVVPTLCSLMAESRSKAWGHWLDLSADLRTPQGRSHWYSMLVSGLP
jgi:CHAD domain-containing protein